MDIDLLLFFTIFGIPIRTVACKFKLLSKKSILSRDWRRAFMIKGIWGILGSSWFELNIEICYDLILRLRGVFMKCDSTYEWILSESSKKSEIIYFLYSNCLQILQYNVPVLWRVEGFPSVFSPPPFQAFKYNYYTYK